MNILRNYIDVFRSGRDLDGADAETFLDALIGETDEALLGDVFRSWNEKNISENEIYEIARVMRGRCIRVNTKHEGFLDIVGTGGSRRKTFNVSTAAAFVAAGAGVPVAKHGNKAATSNSGSADVLSTLGIEPAVDAETAERCLNEIGICFMFAPNFHRLSPTLAKVRRGLGFPTIFNCVGPICNPANAPHQVIGVWAEDLVPKMANALARLGTKKSWVVHARDGLDEIAIGGPTFVAEIDRGFVSTFEITPEDFHLAPSPDDVLRADSPEQSADVIRKIFEGNCSPSGARDLVVINAAAGLYVSGRAATMREAADLALLSITGGSAGLKLEELKAASKR